MFKGEALDEFGDMSFEQLRSLDRGETVPNNIAHETSRVSKEKSPSMSEKRVALETSRKKARPSTAVHSGRTLVSKPTLSTNLTIAVTKRDDEDKNSLSDLMKPDWYKFRPQTGRNRIEPMTTREKRNVTFENQGVKLRASDQPATIGDLAASARDLGANQKKSMGSIMKSTIKSD